MQGKTWPAIKWKPDKEKEPLEIQILRLAHINLNVIRGAERLNGKKKNSGRKLKILSKNSKEITGKNYINSAIKNSILWV